MKKKPAVKQEKKYAKIVVEMDALYCDWNVLLVLKWAGEVELLMCIEEKRTARAFANRWAKRLGGLDVEVKE